MKFKMYANCDKYEAECDLIEKGVDEDLAKIIRRWFDEIELDVEIKDGKVTVTMEKIEDTTENIFNY